MKQFKITDAMRKWCEKNKSELLSEDYDTRDYIAVEFCNHFGTSGNFDTRGGNDFMQMYVGDVCGMTVVVEGDIWRGSIDDFLDNIDYMENRLIRKNKELKSLHYNDYRDD